jgi:hypothetical protein
LEDRHTFIFHGFFLSLLQPGSQLSGAKKESKYLNWISCYTFLGSKKTFLNQKFYVLLCALLKIENEFAFN